MEKRWTFICGLTVNSPSMANSKWQTIPNYRTSIRKCAAPGISCVWSKCVNEQMSRETERECTAEEDLSDMFITLGIDTYNKQLKCFHTKYG